MLRYYTWYSTYEFVANSNEVRSQVSEILDLSSSSYLYKQPDLSTMQTATETLVCAKTVQRNLNPLLCIDHLVNGWGVGRLELLLKNAANQGACLPLLPAFTS